MTPELTDPVREASPDAVHEPTMHRRFAAESFIDASDIDVFAAVDRHTQLSGHMTKASWMMGGGHMDMAIDSGRFQQLGSHLRLSGRAFGISIFLDEVVTRYRPPHAKEWQTVGEPKLLIIGGYRMGFAVMPQDKGCVLRISIEYDIPRRGLARVLGYLLGPFYARWCVKSMLQDTRARFAQAKPAEASDA